MRQTALLIGGTGPTGPFVAEGLLERCERVAMFHTGTHELADNQTIAHVEHIHGNPYASDGLDVLGDRSFDVVVAAYGKTAMLAQHFAGRCNTFVAVGGVPVYRGYFRPSSTKPFGMRVPTREHDATAVDSVYTPGAYPVAAMLRAEETLLRLHYSGAFNATVVRYPMLYGARNVQNREWLVVRRVLEGRRSIILPDGGMQIHARLAARNAAAALLSVVDQPTVAAGQVYNGADAEQFSLRQWVELVAEAMGASLEVESVPASVPNPGLAFLAGPVELTPHSLLDTSRIRTDLGFQDVTTTRDAIKDTVDWCVANATHLRNLDHGDPFDYGAEDCLLDAWRDAQSRLARVASRFEQAQPLRNPQITSRTVGGVAT